MTDPSGLTCPHPLQPAQQGCSPRELETTNICMCEAARWRPQGDVHLHFLSWLPPLHLWGVGNNDFCSRPSLLSPFPHFALQRQLRTSEQGQRQPGRCQRPFPFIPYVICYQAFAEPVAHVTPLAHVAPLGVYRRCPPGLSGSMISELVK